MPRVSSQITSFNFKAVDDFICNLRYGYVAPFFVGVEPKYLRCNWGKQVFIVCDTVPSSFPLHGGRQIFYIHKFVVFDIYWCPQKHPLGLLMLLCPDKRREEGKIKPRCLLH